MAGSNYQLMLAPCYLNLLQPLGVNTSSKFILGNAADASKFGLVQETLQDTVRRASKVMTELEARQVLGVTEKTAWEEVLKASVAL